MKIATWNVNSLRARADRVEDWLRRTDVDVLAIQETKCKDENFPWELFENNDYEVAHFGVNQWNGVAIASRVGLDDVERTFGGQPSFGKGGKDPIQEPRAMAATCNGVRVWSLYVPNGRALDDEHMEYKLQWLDVLKDNAASWLERDPDAQIALAGDWNIAPRDEDVWDTYWDYTQLRFPRGEGMRIDFALTSPALAARVNNAWIDREERKGKGASDHAPVVVELAG